MRVLLFLLLAVLFAGPAAMASPDGVGGIAIPEPPDCSAMRCGVSRGSCGTLNEQSDVILYAGDDFPLINFGARLMFRVCKGTENRIVQFEVFPGFTANDEEGARPHSVPLLRLRQPEADELCFDYFSSPAAGAPALSPASPIAASHCVGHQYPYAVFDVRVGDLGTMEHRVKLGPGHWTNWSSPGDPAVDVNLLPDFEAFLFGL